MASTNEISESAAHIPASNLLQPEQAETELQCLRKKEAAMILELETSADQRRVIPSSSFVDMPEDVLREICVAFIGADKPILGVHLRPLPHTLMHISSGMRRTVLRTPSIWASINIQVHRYRSSPSKRLYTALVREARKWFERAGGLALSISVEIRNSDYGLEKGDDIESPVDPATILFDFLLGFSSRWKSIRFSCSTNHTLIARIAALSAVDVPQLRSISLRFERKTSLLSSSTLLTIPTMEDLSLEALWIPPAEFSVNWALLTSLTLRGTSYHQNLSAARIARILQQTRRLSFCDISVSDRGITSADYPGDINLPLLKVLNVDEGFKPRDKSSGILDLINAPILERFKLRGELPKTSAPTFLKRSPNIRELSLCFSDAEESLANVTESLQHCPSLIVLSLQPHWMTQSTVDGNRFLKSFMQEGVTCPDLEYFTFEGSIIFSLQTLRQFLEAKQRGLATSLSHHPWKRVTIDVKGIADVDVRQQMLNLFSKKLEEGLDVGLFVKQRARG